MTQLNEAFLEDFARFGPIGKSLGMLIRPAFVAPKGKTLVWGDWANIEARVLPWLSASEGGDQQLEAFRASDNDKTKPDVYVFNAAKLLKRDAQEMWDAFLAGEKWAKSGRQSHGKVPVLSLGFGGGVGALMKMAINYRVYLDEAAAKEMVDGWREANPWAKEFWGVYHTNEHGDVMRASGLWGAVNMALRNPGDAYTAGRVAYIFDQNYLGGTLFCALPCGRLLSYPEIKLRTRRFKDKATDEMVEKTALWYRKGYGWSALWHGKCAENITQAVAGSILRETLVSLEGLELFETVGHTHDEVVLECEDSDNIVPHVKALLKVNMEQKREWRVDLPLAADITDGWWYSKAEE